MFVTSLQLHVSQREHHAIFGSRKSGCRVVPPLQLVRPRVWVSGPKIDRAKPVESTSTWVLLVLYYTVPYCSIQHSLNRIARALNTMKSAGTSIGFEVYSSILPGLWMSFLLLVLSFFMCVIARKKQDIRVEVGGLGKHWKN